ncbi:MAG: hypothetical protein JO270_15950 [Acidobacteriaceae bacterium]|nr:hypothetical protein [Acidobacteriaceae bacterium]MBV8569967.1 hypothetical protein [Acidobacteriaceae bacterium]
MAEWQYQIHHVDLETGANFDTQLAATLSDFGKQGWELAEALPEKEKPGSYLLIFKSAKPLD